MDTIIEALPRVGACLMILIGLIGFFKPRLMLDAMQIRLDSTVAFSEVRTVFGGINLGLAVAALAFDNPLVYMTLGLAWVFGLLARFWSMIVDKTSLKDTIPGVIVDGGLAFLFLSGLIWQ